MAGKLNWLKSLDLSLKEQCCLQEKKCWYTVLPYKLYAAFNSISVISWRQYTLFMSFLGFTSTRLGLWSILPKDTSMKKPRGSSAALTQDPWVASQTLYHWATQSSPFKLDLSKILSFGKELKKGKCMIHPFSKHEILLTNYLMLLLLSHTIPTFDTSGKESFWKHCGKRRKCW